MLAKQTDNGFHFIQGTLTPTHTSLGYIDVPDEDIDLKEDGSLYPYYKLENGRYVQDTNRETAEAFAESVRKGEQLVKQHVMNTITAYNTAHSVSFESVYNCSVYIQDNTYTHYQFCVDIIAFNKDCWETSRQIQADVIAGNIPQPETEEAFIALLPVYNGAI